VNNRCEKTKAREPETESIASMLEKLIEKNRAHARDLEELARRVEAAEAHARQREAELAARLDETRAELADAVAAEKREKEKRIEAEQAVDAARAAIEQARQVLDTLSAPHAAHARVVEAPLAIKEAEAEIALPPAAAEVPAEADLRVELSNVGTEELSDEIEGENSIGGAAVALALSPAESAALEAQAAQEGFLDGAAWATHLIREALRKAESPVAWSGDTATAEGG
jgi:iron-sulfur cluster repair protein YtfE (RIC family)